MMSEYSPDQYVDYGYSASNDQLDIVPDFVAMGVNNNSHNSVRELASLSLNIQSKKFYLDVKENLSGRFLKVAEINVSGIKNKVILDMCCSKLLLHHLVTFAEFYVQLGPQPAPPVSCGVFGGSRPLKSESFKRPQAFDRIYHLDLAENDKGVFLKLSCANQNGGGRGGFKQAVVFPAQGIVELRDKLKQLLDEFYTEEVEVPLPSGRKLNYENKILFMDVSYSNRGAGNHATYNGSLPTGDYHLKMSEILKQNPSHASHQHRRQTITIPRRLWQQVRDHLDELLSETANLMHEESELNNESVQIDAHLESLTSKGKDHAVVKSQPPISVTSRKIIVTSPPIPVTPP